MANSPSLPLSNEDRQEVFKLATSGFASKYSNQIQSGMSDAELGATLKSCFGIFAGSGGPNRLSVCYAGSGLRIWGGWQTVNHVTENPLFKGALTIATARQTYSILNPDDKQMSLF